MKNDIWIWILTILLFGIFLYQTLSLTFSKVVYAPQKDFCFLQADVLFGNIPPGTAEVSKSFEKYRGWYVNFNGRFYVIARIANPNPYYPHSIRLPGNELVRYKKRFVPVFRNAGIEDKIEEE